MKKIRVCIGTNDGQNIAKTHMGDTKKFHIYDITENSINTFIEERINTAQALDHAKADKMKAIIKLVEDANVFIAQQKSPNFVRIASKTKYQPIVVKAEEISDILITLSNSFEEINNLVLRRENGETFPAIPEL